MGKVRRTLSILLSVAMVVTCVPQTGLSALAANETPGITEAAGTETAEVKVETPESNSEVADDAEAEDAADGEDSTEVIGEGGEAQTPADDEKAQEPVVDDEAAEEVEEPTVDVMVTGAEHIVTMPTSSEGYTISENADKATEGTDYTFKVTPATNWQINAVTYTVDATDGKKNAKCTAEGTTYTIPGGDITGDVTVTVDAAKIQYNVEVEYKDAAVDFSCAAITEAGAKTGKTNAGEALAFTAIAKAGSKITGIAYTMGDVDAVEMELKDDGSYSIANVSGNVKITIESESTYKVTFAKTNTNVTEITDIKVGTEDATPAKLDSDVTNWEVSVKEGETLSFKVKTAQYFMVSEDGVTGSNEETVQLKDGVYSLKVDAPTTLAIATVLDPKQCGAFTFALSEGSDKGSATAVVEMADGETDNDTIATNKLEASDKVIVTRNSKVVLYFEATDGYELGDVTIGGEKKTADIAADTDKGTPAKWTIELTSGKTVAVEVATTPKGSDNPGTVQVDFDSAVEHLALESVKVDGVKVDKTADAETYAVKQGAKKVEIAISATGAFEPDVTSTNDLAGDPVVTADGDKKIYTYQFLARKLTGETEVFTVSEKAVKHNISVAGDGVANVTVSASINGRAIAGNAPYSVAEGETVVITVAQKDNCTLKTVKYTVGDGTEKTAKVNKGVATITEKVTDDIVITVEATAEYKAAALTDVTDPKNPKVIEAVNGVYNVSYDGEYTVGLTQGVDTTPLAVANVKIFDNKNKELTEGVTVNTDDATAPVIKLSNNNKVAGQKLTAKLFVAGADGDAAPVDTKVAYTLQVSNPVTEIKVNKTNAVQQPTDTKKTYAITINKGADFGKLQAKPADGVTADVIKNVTVSGNSLEITTGQTPTSADDVKVIVSAGETIQEVTVTTAALINSSQTPTVTQKGATDIDLTLTLGAKNIDNAVSGTVLYEVKVTPKNADGEKKTDNRINAAVTKYFVKDGDSQDVTIKVAKDDKVLGDGEAWSFDVAVKLVHAKAVHAKGEVLGITATDLIDGENSSNAKALVAKTKTPAWESNLKLKKGTTTIYTGQPDVPIATAQFSKTTTYTEIDPDDIYDIGTYSNGSPLNDFEVSDDGTISVSAGTSTAVGKHTIQVVARARKDANAYTMYASRATIVVTVVRGIDSLGINIPSRSLYKEAGKAATLKAAAYYNGDSTGKDKTVAPKTKKVAWTLVSKDSDGKSNDVAFDSNGKVTIKNGTVTVAKDYVLKPTADENTFRIKVSVDNGEGTKKPQWIGSAPAIYSAPITITNESPKVSNVAVIKWNGGNATVVAKTTMGADGKAVATPVDASKLVGGQVVAFTTDILKDSYPDAEIKKLIVPETNLTFKSSKAKNVDVNYWGGLTVNSPANGVKLTVTANDGSKNNKAELTLNVLNDGILNDNLALDIYKAKSTPNSYDRDRTYVDWTSSVYSASNNSADKDKAEVPVEYNGSAVSHLALQVCNLTSNGWYEAASKYANFTVKVKKGGKITGEDEGGSNTTNFKVYYVSLDKHDAEIELSYTTSEGTKKTRVYKLTNNDVLTSGAKVKAKVIGNLHQNAEAAQQDVKLELEIPTALADSLTGDGKTSAAKIDVDWSKMNAKNEADLRYFANSFAKNEYDIKIVDYNANAKKATVQLAFNEDSRTAFLQKSYALKVSVGSKVTESGITTFKPEAPAVAATVKVDKTKKFTFKPTTSYTIGGKDGYAVLGGKSSIPANEVEVSFELLNLVDKNGQENHFTDKFEATKDGKLKVKTGVDASTIAKDDLTGYLSYYAETDKSYYDTDYLEGYAKIKVTINDSKAVVKYTHDPVELPKENGKTATVQVKVNTKDATQYKNVKIAYAMFDKDNNPFTVAVNADGTLLLTMTGTPTKNKLTAKVWIVPEDSRKISDFRNADGSPKNAELSVYKQSASSMSLTVTFVESEVEPPVETVETVAAAKTAINKWIEKVNDPEETPEWLTKVTDKESAKKAVEDELAKAVNAASAIKIEVLDDAGNAFTYKEAKVDEEGSVSGKIKVSNTTEGTEEVPAIISFSFTIPALTAEEPDPSDEKTLDDVAAELAKVTDWKNASDELIKVTYKTENDENKIDGESNIIDSLVTAVDTWIKKQTGDVYTGITVTKNDTAFTIDTDKGEAKITVTLKKGEGEGATETTATITVTAEKDTTVVTPPAEGGDEE